MKHTLRLLLPGHGFDPALVSGAGLTKVAGAAERAGFAAIAFTEHPAPGAGWLANGHHSLDPLSALAYVAAGTERLRLMPHLLVLPYRPALLALKQAVTVDLISGGRLILCVGAGYQESEFAALGVPFDRRNELFDEALDVVDRAWSATQLTMSGHYMSAADQGLLPGHQPQAPLWIGGNTDRALHRVVTHGRGWSPLLLSAAKARTTKTTPMTTPEDLRAKIARLTDMLHEAGRDPAEIPIQVDYAPILEMGPAEVVRDAVGRLAEVGATWVVSQPPTDSFEHVLDSVERFGEEIIRGSSSDD